MVKGIGRTKNEMRGIAGFSLFSLLPSGGRNGNFALALYKLFPNMHTQDTQTYSTQQHAM